MSELALQLIAENKRTKNPVLDLGNCRLTEFPMEVSECTHLEELNFKTNYWDGEAGEIKIPSNELQPNLIARIPDLKHLSYLEILRVGGFFDAEKEKYLEEYIWGLQSLDFVKNISELQILDISGCQVSDLGPLQSLTNLTELKLLDEVTEWTLIYEKEVHEM